MRLTNVPEEMTPGRYFDEFTFAISNNLKEAEDDYDSDTR